MSAITQPGGQVGRDRVNRLLRIRPCCNEYDLVVLCDVHLHDRGHALGVPDALVALQPDFRGIPLGEIREHGRGTRVQTFRVRDQDRVR